MSSVSTALLVLLLAVVAALLCAAVVLAFPPHRLAYRFSQSAFRRAAERAGLWMSGMHWSILDAPPPPSRDRIRRVVRIYHLWPVTGDSKDRELDFDTWPGARGAYRVELDTGEELVFPDDVDDVCDYLGVTREELRERCVAREVPRPRMFGVWFAVVLAFDIAIVVMTTTLVCQCVVR